LHDRLYKRRQCGTRYRTVAFETFQNSTIGTLVVALTAALYVVGTRVRLPRKNIRRAKLSVVFGESGDRIVDETAVGRDRVRFVGMIESALRAAVRATLSVLVDVGRLGLSGAALAAVPGSPRTYSCASNWRCTWSGR